MKGGAKSFVGRIATTCDPKFIKLNNLLKLLNYIQQNSINSFSYVKGTVEKFDYKKRASFKNIY